MAQQVRPTDKIDQLRNESAKCRIQLVTKKELIKGEVTRIKKDIRNIAWLVENGLSTQSLLTNIGESYDKLVKKTADLVDDWESFITLTASSNGPIQSNNDRVSLQKDIADEVIEINKFKEMVDLIKYENMHLFSKIEKSAQKLEESQLVSETELNPQLKPAKLTVNSTFIDTKIYSREFTRYIQSRGYTDEELIFDVASATIDHFWCTMLEQGWKFNKNTTLREYCFMIDSISKERFSITNIRKELFNMKQSQKENNLEFLEKVNQIIQMADWPNISVIEATCLIFISGSTCEDSKQICSKFMTKTPEGDVNKLREQLEVVMEVSKKVPGIENCTFCGKIGHKNDKCEAKCHLCASHNHFPGSCQGQAKCVKN